VTSLDRRFWRLYASSATSNLADGIGRTALPLLAVSYTRSPLLVAGLVTFSFLPWLLFALPSGALVDRVDRRRAMAVANLTRAVAMGLLALAVLTHTASIMIIYLVAFALGLAETVYDCASRALLPQVVGNRDLDRANSLLTIEETLGQVFLGGPVGSALFALAVSVPFLLNAGGFTLAALLVLTLRGSFRPARPEEPTSIRHDVADGIRWLVANRFLRGLTLISATTSCVQSMANGVFVLYVLDELRLPSGDFGLVLLAGGIGALGGGVATPPLTRRFGRGPMLTVGALVSGLATLTMSLTRNGFAGSALFGIAAAGVMVWNVLTMSLRQAMIPQHLFGRVQGAYRTLVWGGIPLGALAGGGLGDIVGIRPVFAVSGAGLALVSGWLWVLVRRHKDLLVDDPEHGSGSAPGGPVPISAQGGSR
jgi:MFS family permease